MALELWPGETIGRVQFIARSDGASVSGGRTVGGAVPLADYSGGGFWRVREVCSVRSEAHRRLWGRWAAYLHNGVRPVEVRVGQRHTRPSGVSSAALAASAALRATTLQVMVSGGGALEGGHRFSIDHASWGARAYDIVDATDNGGGSWAITISPPLREAESVATELDFETPRVVCKLTNPEAFPIAEDGNVRNPSGTAEWMEHLEPVA